jgi:TonB family protein
MGKYTGVFKKSLRCAVIFLIFELLILPTIEFGDNKDIHVELKFYEGLRGKAPQTPRVVTSYSIKYLDTGNEIPVFKNNDMELAERLISIYNINHVKLLTRSGMVWIQKTSYPVYRLFLIDEHEFAVDSKLLDPNGVFRITVIKRGESKHETLLETKITLPEESETVFGFQDNTGKIYFLAFKRDKDQANPHTDIVSSLRERQRNQRLPRLIYKKIPHYPPSAVEKKIQGAVYLEITIDTKGLVIAATAAHSTNQVFNFHALDAVRQWKYEPYLSKGKPIPITFLVVVAFSLDNQH